MSGSRQVMGTGLRFLDPDRSVQLSLWMDRFDALNTIEIVDTMAAYRPVPYCITLSPDSIPVTRIKTRDDVFEAIAEIEGAVSSVLVESLGYSREEVYRFITAMAELCQNIYYHSVQKGDFYGYMSGRG